MSSVIRVEKNKNYTVMANYHLRDKSLSMKAKGLMSLMLSLPDTWDYSIKGLSAISVEGVDGISSILSELETKGYVARKRIRDKKGRLTGTEYVIFEQPPKRDSPILDSPIQAMPISENPLQLNTYKSNNNKICITNLINQQKYHQSTSQILIDELKDEEITNVVFEELWKVRQLPYWYNTDYRRLTEAIHIMAEWDVFYPNGFQDAFKQKIYELFNNALIEMCFSKKTMYLSQSEVTYEMVIDKINHFIVFEEGDTRYISIFELVEAATLDYEKAEKETTVKANLNYMKSCIWNVMLTGNISLHAKINKEIYSHALGE